jgi:chemotaxis phosphatase CheX-like protein
MPDRVPALLTQVLGEVLQDAAYVFAEPVEGPASWPEPVVSARIAFESVRGGTLRLTAAPGVAAEIAANMLGVDPGDAEAQSHGRAALAEVLNVIGGAFVTRYFGTAVPSQLGLPSAEILAEPPAGRTTAAALVVAESGEPVLLELDME